MFAALLAVIGANAAVPTRRDSWPSFSPDRVKSFALFGKLGFNRAARRPASFLLRVRYYA